MYLLCDRILKMPEEKIKEIIFDGPDDEDFIALCDPPLVREIPAETPKKLPVKQVV